MNADKLAQLLELFETWLASRPSFRTTVEVQAAWEGWKANTAVAAMLAEHDAQPAQAAVSVQTLPLRTAPYTLTTTAHAAQPVGVPEPIEIEYHTDDGERVSDEGIGYARGWNACRRAMLAVAPRPPAQPSADAEDAARYRCLRDSQEHDYVVCHYDSVVDGEYTYSGEGIDELMDAARAVKGGE